MAERLIGSYKDGVWLIDLAPVTNPTLVPTAFASVLGLEIRSDNPLPGLMTAVKDKQMLIVLDNCEHVIDAAAALVIALTQQRAGSYARFVVSHRSTCSIDCPLRRA